MEYIASYAIPFVIFIISLFLLFSKKVTFDDFLDGTKEGVIVCAKLVPTLIVLMVAVSMLSASGAVDFLVRILSPVGDTLGVPIEILPLIIMRPISGSASNAMIAELFEKYGPDSFAGRAASVLLGSSETIIYVAAVYYSSVNIKKTRHTLPAAFLAMLFCVFFSCLVCRLLFG